MLKLIQSHQYIENAELMNKCFALGLKYLKKDLIGK